MRRRKKDNHEEEHSESWLLPYSDLMTLLLALFLVLYSISSADATKFQEISKVFGEIFSSGSGLMEYPSSTPEGIQDEVEENPMNQQITEDKPLPKEKSIPEEEVLYRIQSKINTYITNNQLNNDLETSLTSEGLLLRIHDNVLFDSGKATVRKQDIQLAKEISQLLVMDPPHSVIISGHTDNVPIKNSNFESNWELSVMRAVNFMKIIMENDKLDPQLFSAKGFGEFQPIASNDTKEGKAKNRRVEILIEPNIDKKQD